MKTFQVKWRMSVREADKDNEETSKESCQGSCVGVRDVKHRMFVLVDFTLFSLVFWACSTSYRNRTC